MNKMLDQESVWDEEIQDVLELSNTGKSEMVAGISGEVFTMTYVDGQGQKQTSTMVLSQEDHIVALSSSDECHD